MAESPVDTAQAEESGYGVLFRTVAATIEDSDPNAAESLRRAAVTVEAMVGELRALASVPARSPDALTEALCGSCPGETLPILRCALPEGHEGACEYVSRDVVAHVSRAALARSAGNGDEQR